MLSGRFFRVRIHPSRKALTALAGLAALAARAALFEVSHAGVLLQKQQIFGPFTGSGNIFGSIYDC